MKGRCSRASRPLAPEQRCGATHHSLRGCGKECCGPAARGALTADSPPLALRSAPMPHVQQWARVRARTNCPLRRGAWYRVTRLTPLEAVLEVNQRPVHVPRPFVQVLPLRPRMWSVVPRPRDAVTLPDSWGPRYAVCPDCSARAALHGPSGGMPCPGCGSVFPIAWSDSPWRVFEVLSDRPAIRAMAKVRDAALRLLLGRNERAAPSRPGEH